MPHDPKEAIVMVALLNVNGEILHKKKLKQQFIFEKGDPVTNRGKQFLHDFEVDISLTVNKVEHRAIPIALTTRIDRIGEQ